VYCLLLRLVRDLGVCEQPVGLVAPSQVTLLGGPTDDSDGATNADERNTGWYDDNDGRARSRHLARLHVTKTCTGGIKQYRYIVVIPGHLLK